MRARIKVSADMNVLALYQMLAQNGLWLVKVHNGRVVSMARVPPEVPVESVISGDGKNARGKARGNDAV